MVQMQGSVKADGKIIDLDTPPEPIPSMRMWLRGMYGGESFQIKAVTDSWAMKSMISFHPDLFSKISLPKQQKKNITVLQKF